jgi:hypothetical protein
MLIKDANKIIISLSKPEKMPGYAYGLPAPECKTGAKLRLVQTRFVLTVTPSKAIMQDSRLFYKYNIKDWNHFKTLYGSRLWRR